MSVRPLSGELSNLRLSERRRLRRRRMRIALCLLLSLLSGAFLWGIWQDSARISHVQIFGPPSLESFGGASANQSLAEIATNAMRGSYFGIIPRDSTFFFPGARIRADILSAHPDIAAVALFRERFTGLTVQVHERVPIARWCGLTPTVGVDEYCYLFDANGYLFAAANVASTTPVNNFTLY